MVTNIQIPPVLFPLILQSSALVTPQPSQGMDQYLASLVTDLATILLVAGITTILCKKLGQPLVLGYIIAGFLTGPNCSFFPTIEKEAMAMVWSEIGVIFLLFALGLEFSFYKLKTVGSTAFIATFTEIVGMYLIGHWVGVHVLNWSSMNSIFLGSMLAMSSTTIIIKAFDDLELRGQKFTELVFGILVVEDIAGILIMVLLSTYAQSAGVNMVAILDSVAKLVLFMTVFFVLGIMAIPTFLKWADKIINDETMVVVSIGLCFGMVILADKMGFSTALGAFLMGSVMAEAPRAERIEELVKPVKDLFGAVFFVSVGMMVAPAELVMYRLPITILVVVTIVGKLLVSSLGVLLSGQSLANSLHAGFSLAQIGEFSFIIAGVGISLKAIDDFLYPIIVAVSVITTFTTPYLIKAAEPVCVYLLKNMPAKWRKALEQHTTTEKRSAEDANLLRDFFLRSMRSIGIKLVMLFALIMLGDIFILPLAQKALGQPYGDYVGAGVTLLLCLPLLWALCLSKDDLLYEFKLYWYDNKLNRLPLGFLVAVKIGISAYAISYCLDKAYLPNVDNWYVYIVTFLIMALCFLSQRNVLTSWYLELELKLLENLNKKHESAYRAELMRLGKETSHSWLDTKLYFQEFTVAKESPLVGKSLKSVNFKQLVGCNVARCSYGKRSTDFPSGNYILGAEERILVLGTIEQIKLINELRKQKELGLLTQRESRGQQAQCSEEAISLTEYIEQQEGPQEEQFLLASLHIEEHSPYRNRNLWDTDIREKYHCQIIGVDRDGYTILDPKASFVIKEGDYLWLLGHNDEAVRTFVSTRC